MREKIILAQESLRKGNFVIILDSPERENEADLMMAAEHVTPEKIAFMINHCSGVICVPMTKKRLQELGLPRMVEKNSDKFQTPFTISVDAKNIRDGGVSAFDRTATIKTLLCGKMNDLARPGHVFPLAAREKGLLERQGHTEGSIDLLNLSKLPPVAVICELMNKDGTMMRGKELKNFAEKQNILLISVQEIGEYRKTVLF
ncbi:3,4-dihydroxy-2-butanone-4-phosphate synthase [Candidatus Woesearchaeota archaeon]|nr:3,4-dihydroxy-2-butanone-4-phosphate synthase [Candidatus Woesearchaeota archaeon]